MPELRDPLRLPDLCGLRVLRVLRGFKMPALACCRSSCPSWITNALRRRDQPRVRPIDLRHLRVRSALHDLAAFEHNNLVAIADRAQAMRDDQAGAAAPSQLVVDQLLGERI